MQSTYDNGFSSHKCFSFVFKTAIGQPEVSIYCVLFFIMSFAILTVIGFFASAKPTARFEEVRFSSPFLQNGFPPVVKAKNQNSHSPLEQKCYEIEYPEKYGKEIRFVFFFIGYNYICSSAIWAYWNFCHVTTSHENIIPHQSDRQIFRYRQGRQPV